jgi:hypothetical protein
MRVIFGMILGSALTIGAAYVHDQMFTPSQAAPAPGQVTKKPVVNWDVVDANARLAKAMVREQWDKLQQ